MCKNITFEPVKILFKFPSRSRPDKFFKAIKHLQQNIVDKNYVISATLDENDRSMNISAIKEKLITIENLTIAWGLSRNKIHAINRDVPESDWDILVLMSDDMKIIASGFDNIIRKDFEQLGSLDRIIHYTDGFKHGNIMSFPVMGKDWYDNFGYIYHPSYLSLFCDEELYQVGVKLKKLYSSPHAIVVHEHPAWIGGPMDEQLRYTQQFYSIDKRTFELRRRANYYIK